MRAVVLREVGRPAAVEELTLRPIADHEVMVQMSASGVCHTDLSVRDGGMPALLPCTFGHEGAGIVTDHCWRSHHIFLDITANRSGSSAARQNCPAPPSRVAGVNRWGAGIYGCRVRIETARPAVSVWP